MLSPHPSPTPTPRRILIVEDCSMLTTLFGVVLRRAGHSVETVARGADALARLRTSDYDVMLADLTPGDSRRGRELVSAVRQICRDVRVILSTGTFEDARELEGADEVLLKPFTPTQLRCAVANLRPAAELSAAPSPSPALRHQDYCRQTAFLPPLPRARASTPAQDAPDSAPTCQIRRRHR